MHKKVLHQWHLRFYCQWAFENSLKDKVTFSERKYEWNTKQMICWYLCELFHYIPMKCLKHQLWKYLLTESHTTNIAESFHVRELLFYILAYTQNWNFECIAIQFLYSQFTITDFKTFFLYPDLQTNAEDKFSHYFINHKQNPHSNIVLTVP